MYQTNPDELAQEIERAFTENVFYMLTPPESDGSQMERFLSRVTGFNTQQKVAVKKFIKLYIETETSYPDPNRERAIQFWEKYAQAD